MKKYIALSFFLFFLIWLFLSCSPTPESFNQNYEHYYQNLKPNKGFNTVSGTLNEKPLSLSNHYLKTCAFDPKARIVHFPMLHYPPSGKRNASIKERVAKSQFQLLHTILAYAPNIIVFEERMLETLDPNFLQSLRRGQVRITYTDNSGNSLNIQSLFNQGRNLFQRGIPPHYENLSEAQKSYLALTGGSLTAYFLSHIPIVHKVGSMSDYQNKQRQHGNSMSFIVDYREELLKKQVLSFLNNNPSFQGIALIAYGNGHDFSNEFQGYPFQAGIHCMQWFGH